VTTGAITVSGSGFAGVQTASFNSGALSSNNAATSIAANANITFGAP
jgi:hypothetical protein